MPRKRPIDARLAEAKEQVRKLSEEKRKAETRRKIIEGGAVEAVLGRPFDSGDEGQMAELKATLAVADAVRAELGKDRQAAGDEWMAGSDATAMHALLGALRADGARLDDALAAIRQGKACLEIREP